ncbi:MAG: S8 family serine peptidase [Candidatus Thermoplasmatota archaeon]
MKVSVFGIWIVLSILISTAGIHSESYTTSCVSRQLAIDITPQTESEIIPDEVLIGFCDSSDIQALVYLISSSGGIILSKDEVLRYILARVEGDSDTFIDRIKKSPQVRYVEPNYLRKPTLVPNDPKYSTQWAIPKIKADNAWDIVTGSNSVILAIVDSGVDYNHPDLASNMWSSSTGTHGYDFVNNDNDPLDDFGHGTMCAGIAAAVMNNNYGIAGIAQVKIMAVKVSDSHGNAIGSAEIQGIKWAVDNGADIISISLGGSGAYQSEMDACNYAWNKGAVIVSASGNAGKHEVYCPAAYANVIATGAIDKNDQRWAYSNYGPELELAAPGVDILTTNKGNAYITESGTSLACPHVSGVAGLILAANSSLTNAEVRTILQNTAVDLGAQGRDEYYGFGRIDAEGCVREAGGIEKHNIPPVLSLGEVTPKIGTNEDFYNYTVTYTDTDNSPGPHIVRVVIDAGTADEQTKTMSKKSGDITKGAIYEVTGIKLKATSLSHTYKFNATDGEAYAIPILGEGPVVNKTNKKPFWNGSKNGIPDTIILEEDFVEYSIDLALAFDDPDKDILEYKLRSSDLNSLSTSITCEAFNAIITEKKLKFESKKDKYGKYKIVLNANDTHNHDIEHELTIEISEVNDPPIINNIGDITGVQDEWINITIEAKDEADCDFLTFSDNTTLFDIDPTGKIAFLPSNDDVGMHKISIVVDDGREGGKVYGNFTLVIENKNDPPVIVTVNSIKPVNGHVELSVQEDTYLNFTVVAEDIDIGDALTFGVDIETMKASVVLVGQLSNEVNISFLPFKNFNGLVFFNITVEDDGKPRLSDKIQVIVEVAPVNDPPPASKIIYEIVDADSSTLEKENLTVMFVAEEVQDIDGDKLRYWWDFNASDGIKKDASGLVVNYTFPSAGNYRVTLTVSDGKFSVSVTEDISVKTPQAKESRKDYGKEQKIKPNKGVFGMGVNGDIAVVIASVFVILVVGLFLITKKKAKKSEAIYYGQQSYYLPQKPHDYLTTQQPLCPTCGQLLSYIEQNNSYYCYWCQKYE